MKLHKVSPLRPTAVASVISGRMSVEAYPNRFRFLMPLFTHLNLPTTNWLSETWNNISTKRVKSRPERRTVATKHPITFLDQAYQIKTLPLGASHNNALLAHLS